MVPRSLVNEECGQLRDRLAVAAIGDGVHAYRDCSINAFLDVIEQNRRMGELLVSV